MDPQSSWQGMTEQFRRVFGDEFVQNLMKSINVSEMMNQNPMGQPGMSGRGGGGIPGAPGFPGMPPMQGMPGMQGFPFGANTAGAPVSGQGGTYPRVNLYQTRHEVIVVAELPGAAQGDVKISAMPDRLRLRGQIRRPFATAGEDQVISSELFQGEFARDIPLPTRVRTEKVRANYRQGYLEVRMVKEDPQSSHPGSDVPIRFE